MKKLTIIFSMFLSVTSICNAGCFVSLKSSGSLTKGLSFFANENERKQPKFFDTLDPHLSEVGGVRTFSLKTTPAGMASSVNLIKPLALGRITSSFGSRFHPTLKIKKYHAGIDIAAPIGTPIRCCSSGKVTFSGWKSGYGEVVIVDHGNGLQTFYAHCSKLEVKIGQVVTSGQRIALVGKTGRATGSHLHFEIRRNGVALNPYKYNIRY